MDDDYDPYRQVDSLMQRQEPHSWKTRDAVKMGDFDNGKDLSESPIEYAPSRTTSEREAAGQPPPATPDSLVGRSISRSSRPTKLNLSKSNGSTAASISSATWTASPARPHSSRSNASFARSASVTSNLPPLPAPPTDRPLPPLPPGPTLAMGNSASKSENDLPEAGRTPGKAPNAIVKRRPVGGAATWRGTLAATKEKKLPSPRQAVEGLRGKFLQNAQAGPNGHFALPSSPRPPERASEAQTKASPQTPSPAPSRMLPPTPPDEDSDGSPVSLTHEELQDSQRPSTPPLNSPQLPPPAGVPDETPSKYGILAGGEEDDSEGGTNQLKPKNSKHFRGKSSTGLNIFKATAALQKAHSYLNTMSPPTSRPETPLASPQHTSPTPMSSHDQEESIVNTRDSSISRHSVVPHSPPIAHHESNQSNGSFSHYNPPPHVPSVESLLSSERPIYSSAPHLTVVQTHCLSRHKRWRSSKNMQASIACALCFTEKDDLSDENGAGERWSCIWCALRVCLPCRNLVEQYMGRDPERALIGSEFQRRPGGPPPWAMARTPFGPGPGLLPNGALAPPPNVFGMGHAAGWHSTSDLHAGSGRGSAVGSRRASASTMTASARPSLEVRDSATSIRGRKTQMSDVVGIDDDATPRKPSAMSAYGERGHPSMDADRRTMSFTSRSPLGMREEG